jgi:hypothetical protein
MRWRRLRGEVGLGIEIQENPDKTWMIASFMDTHISMTNRDFT